ncbi:unnamed protein product, partial [marine sediment metagenome]
HPIIAPMIERNAFIGGCDGVSVIKSADLIEEKPKGTIPHALVLLFGDTIEATKAFDDVIDKNVMRVALIDTFLDEKFEAIRVAEAMGDKLFGMRLDTPSTRRGDFKGLIKETRWELDIRGYNNIKLLVSGGIDEENIRKLKDVVNGFGVGTSISNAPVIDFALDIVEIDGKPFAKRGVSSGAKNVFRCKSCNKDVILYKKETGRRIKRKCDCGGELENLLFPLTESKKIIRELSLMSKLKYPFTHSSEPLSPKYTIVPLVKAPLDPEIYPLLPSSASKVTSTSTTSTGISHPQLRSIFAVADPSELVAVAVDV